MTRKALLAGLLTLVLAFSVAGMALAQGGGAAHWVCVSGFGCAMTPYTAEELQEKFPDADVLMSSGDFVPQGVWEFSHHEGLMMCGDMSFPVPASTSQGEYTPLTEEEGGGVLATSPDTPNSAVMQPLGQGFYYYTMNFQQDGMDMKYWVFVVMSSETTLEGQVWGTMNGAGQGCALMRSFSAAAVQ